MNATEGRRALVLAVLAPALLSGCAAGIVTGVSEPVRPRGPAVVRTLAVMPVTMEAGSQGMAPDLMAELIGALEARFPELWVVHPDEVRLRLSASSAATEYAAAMSDYELTGLVESDRLERIADALGATHFLQLRGSYFREEFLSHDLFDYESVVTEERQQVYAVARLWGAGGGGPVWEAVAHTSSETSTFTHGREPFELVAELVVSLVDRMPVRALAVDAVR